MRNRSRGYILITLMLFLALLAIAALAVLPDVVFQAKRDREEESIHRGVAYARGIRRYFKKYGRYPTRLDDLENTNNLRFIRKRYKDPITNEEFTILRYGDPRLAGVMLGAIGGPGLQGQVAGQGLGGTASRALNSTVTQTTTTDATGSDSGNPNGQTNPGTPVSSLSSSSSDNSSSTQKVFGGGPIVGVVSASTAQTIREFDGKNHYKDWLFIYVPMSDRGGLINAPYQASLNRIIPGQVGVTPGMVPPSGQPGGGMAQPPQPQNPPNR